jgi:hypothetical protein
MILLSMTPVLVTIEKTETETETETEHSTRIIL